MVGFQIQSMNQQYVILNTTGAEISFQIMPPQADIPFYHKHRRNEEIYIILKGNGQFQIDGNILDVEIVDYH